MHDSDDLQFITPYAENQRIGKNIESAFAQLAFKTPVNLRVGDDAVFGVFPFFQEPGLETGLLLSIPCRGLETFFAGGIVVVDMHDSKSGAKALLGLVPEVFGGNEFDLASIDVADAAPQFLDPFATWLVFVLIETFEKPGGQVGAIHTREMKNFFFQALV
ncbi:MAG: hypothetical protein MUF86_08880 [Akkermansiaceae bacterium]|jgi:hypothetical protein|nr:hypothetical protein [Akkermansiaceae bacterium]MCU0777768.1 hypothetical protein [Akkermansiaceae bacterium]